MKKSELKTLIKHMIVEEAKSGLQSERVLLTIKDVPKEHQGKYVEILQAGIDDVMRGVEVKAVGANVEVSSDVKPGGFNSAKEVATEFEILFDQTEDRYYNATDDDADFETSITIDGKAGGADAKLEAINSVLSTGVYSAKDAQIKKRGKNVQVITDQEIFYGYNGEPTAAQLRRNPNLIGIDESVFNTLVN